ncbi:protein phosphatase 2C domain-containing protein [Streptomyces sp. NBC_00442]|uniref:protein phosphatase 2C domain-containing protein n=1 Tax=Streptomyces sp. NBC_00442 TaxID=2903651 RepID=UPI002E241A0B
MSQQGERPTRDDDWWNRLYDESAPDAGPDGSRDSLDDRFNSASDTVGSPPTEERAGPGPDPVPGPGPDSEAVGPDAAGSHAEASHAAGSRAAGSHTAGSRAAAPEAASREAAGSRAAPVPEAAAPEAAVPEAAAPEGSAPEPPVRPAPEPPAAAPERPAVEPPGPEPVPPPASAPGPAAPWGPGSAAGSAAGPRKPAAWWESVAAAPPPPAEPVPELPPGWAEGTAPDAADRPPARPGAAPVTAQPEPSGADDGPRVANAPSSLRTPATGRSGPPVTAPDEQFGPARTAPPEQFAPAPRPRTGHVGDGPPTYDAEPTALATARPDALDELVADTVLDGARYGAYVLRAGSSRGDSARYRGEPRRDALLTARFGTGENALVLVAVASGARTSDRAHLAAADACHWIGGAIGRSHVRLAEDIRAGRRGDLKSGLHRLTDRSYGMLRARAGELGMVPEEYTASLRCLLLSADPACRTRVFFGVGHGGLFRLRGGVWQDIEPAVPEPGAMLGAPVVGFGSAPAETEQGDRLTMDLNTVDPLRPSIDAPAPPGEPFRFRASVARPGDALLLCSPGLAEPLRGESALGKELAERWASPEPPGLAAFLADLQLRVKGYADDRTAVAVWEA